MTNTALIIDSDVQFVCSIKPLLETELGVTVAIAQNGDHGITSLYSRAFLFVLLDLRQPYPYPCGLRVLHKIREVCRYTKVVVIYSKRLRFLLFQKTESSTLTKFPVCLCVSDGHSEYNLQGLV